MHERMWLIKWFFDWTSAGRRKAGQSGRCSLRRKYSLMSHKEGSRAKKCINIELEVLDPKITSMVQCVLIPLAEEFQNESSRVTQEPSSSEFSLVLSKYKGWLKMSSLDFASVPIFYPRRQ